MWYLKTHGRTRWEWRRRPGRCAKYIAQTPSTERRTLGSTWRRGGRL